MTITIAITRTINITMTLFKHMVILMLRLPGDICSIRVPVAIPRLFQGFACSCCGSQGVVLRGGFILRFVVLVLVIQGGGFILWFEGGGAGL